MLVKQIGILYEDNKSIAYDGNFTPRSLKYASLEARYRDIDNGAWLNE